MTAMLRGAAALLLVALVCAPAAAPVAAHAAPPEGAEGPRAAAAAVSQTDIFTGEIISRFPQSRAGQAPLYRIRVEEVIKGDLQPGATATLTRPTAFARCDAARLEPNRTRIYLFQLTASGSALLANRCTDVREATPKLLREIRQAVQAEEEAQNPPAPPPEPEPVVLRDLGAGEARPFARAAAPGLAIVIVGVLGLLLTGRLSRRPR